MKKRIMAALLVLTMLLSAVPAMAVDLGNNVGGRDPAQGMNFTTGTVQNKAGAAQKLEVQVKVNQAVASEGVLIYAMVMLTTDYNKLAAGDVSSGTLGTDKFASYAATAGYHAIGSAKVPATGDTVTITLTDKGDASSVVPGDYTTVKSFPTQAINASETSYFKDLTLVLFDTHNKAGAASYYVDRFEMDYGGYVRTPSYAVRYNDNGGSVTNYTKTPFIVRAVSYAALEDTLLTGTTPNQELNPAQGTPKRLGYSFLGWSDEKGATEAKYDSTKGMTLKKPLENALYGVTDVYAVWQTISVHFTDKDKEGLTDDGSARVNEKYTSQTFTLDPSSDPRTPKTYTASGAVYVNGDSTTESVDAGQLANGLPKGLAFVKDNTTWRIEGTPQFDSDRPIRLTVTVTDGGNGTKDTLTYTFRKIAKGRRPAPELDWNTALQGRKVTAGEAETGQIIGFYSSNAGAPDYKGLTYQYVHKGAYDEAVGKDEDTEALWVNVELPVEAKEGTATEKPAWTTEYGGTVEDATSGDWIKTPPAEGASMPLQISGLKVDTEYYVRFRATETFDASDPVEVTTSGGGGGSAVGGPSISFHLAGGELPLKDDGSGAPVEFQFLYDGLKAGETVEIPSVEPVREGYSFEGWTDGATLYRYDKDANPAVSVAATDGPLTLAAKWTATTEGFCSVVFYDWDGTLLGSRIVPKGGNLLGDHLTPNQRGDGADQAPLPPEYELLWDVNGNGEYEFVSNNNVGNDAANKMGYTFAGWVDNETGYSVPNAAAGAARGQKIPIEDIVSLSNITTNLVLKAAYDEDGTIIGANAGARRYLISYTPFIAESGALQTSITVRRPQNARRSVEGSLYLQIALQPSDRGQTKIIIPLGTSDCETIEFSMPNGADEKYHATKALALTVLNADSATVSAELSVKAEEIIAH